jgi:mono/diheme cytochrome c family protein
MNGVVMKFAKYSLLYLFPALGLGCADAVYDVETWQSPLASEFKGEPSAEEGAKLYTDEHWEDGSSYSLSCNTCHGSGEGDTLLVDEDDWNRPAHTVWNAPWRETWKGNQEWSEDSSSVLGAYGGQICVTAFFPEGSEMTAEQAAHIEAFIKTLKDDPPDPADLRAQVLDYGFKDWDTEADFLASLVDEAGEWSYGEALGDVDSGEALAGRHCAACHTDSDGTVNPGQVYSAGSAPLDLWVARIRRKNLDSVDRPNARMPGFTVDRLPDEDLRDLLAFLTAHYDG